MNMFLTLGGRIRCRQCKAQSKRTKQQCRSPAMKNKEVCRIHGGLSTGPKTSIGRARCAQVKTIHGRDTRQKRRERSRQSKELYDLTLLGKEIGLFPKDMSLPRGRRPKSE
jgi:hypothetical protein